jgi:PTS system mannose-specific IIA component
MESTNVEVIAGINLPMLIKLASVRIDSTMEEAVSAAQESGKKYINIASHVLSGEN